MSEEEEHHCDAELSRLVRDLVNRRDSASVIPRSKVSHNEWQPELHACHANVEQWVALNTGLVAVRGWLAFDLRAAIAFGQPGRLEFLAHSVVESADGVRADITPVPVDAGLYPFIEHANEDLDFEQLVSERGVIRLRAYNSGLLTFTTNNASPS